MKITKAELITQLAERDRLLAIATSTIRRQADVIEQLQSKPNAVISPYHIPRDVVRRYFAAHDGNPADRSPAAIRKWSTDNPGEQS